MDTENTKPQAPVKKVNLTAQFARDNSSLFSLLKVGEILEGKVIDLAPKGVFVDLGRYGTGVIYKGDLIRAGGTTKSLSLGQVIKVRVSVLDNKEGWIELLPMETERQKNWLTVEELAGKEEVITVQIAEANKGGLIAEIEGLKAFLPASQLSPEHYPNVEDNDKQKIEEKLKELIGQELKVRVIDVNPDTNKLIISEKAASQVNMSELLDKYQVGQVIEGVVSGVADFGVFVKFADNPDIEGLIHISELDYKMIENPKELVKINDTVQAKIIEIKNGKVYLSLKALKEDPWEKIGDLVKEGQEVEGRIYSFNPFGAIVDLSNGLQGQIHITAFGSAEEMKRELKKGEAYKFKVTKVKPEEKRIYLEKI